MNALKNIRIYGRIICNLLNAEDSRLFNMGRCDFSFGKFRWIHLHTSYPTLLQINEASSVASNISIGQMKEVLNKSQYSYQDGYTCIKMSCVMCQKENAMFINKVTGFFLCVECLYCGGWDTFIQLLQKDDSDSGNKIANNAYNLRSVKSVIEGNAAWNAALECVSQHESNCEKENKIEFLNKFNLWSSEGTILEYIQHLNGVVDAKGEHVSFPMLNGKLITGVRRLDMSGEESVKPVNNCVGILRSKKAYLRVCDHALIVTSIKDFLVVLAEQLKLHVICLPHGVASLPQEVLPLLEQYTKLTLWLPEPSSQPSKNLITKLGPQRCYIVRDVYNQAREGYVTGEQSAYQVKKRTPNQIKSFVEDARCAHHKSIVTFAELKDDVLAELRNVDLFEGVKWRRYSTLNEILKGHRRGELTILTGPTGSGKTTFMSDYSLDLAEQGVRTLWGSFEIKNQRLARTMLQQWVRMPLEDHMDKFDEWADGFSALPLYFMTFHGQQQLKEVIEAVEHASYVHDIGHVVIDNVQFMLGISQDGSGGYADRFHKQDHVISAFRGFATNHNCHVTLVMHPRKETTITGNVVTNEDEDVSGRGELNIHSIFGSAKASQEADNVLLIQQRLLKSLQLKKYLQVAKNRYSGDLGVMPLMFDKQSKSFAIKKTKP